MIEFIKNKNLAIYYYPMMALIYSASLCSLDLIHPGLCSALLLIFIMGSMLWQLISYLKLQQSLPKLSTEDIVMSAYFLYAVLSGAWCISFGMPPKVYLGELVTTAGPMAFYYVGRTLTLNGDADGIMHHKLSGRGRFYRNFILSVLLLGILGLILYILAPKFYLDYLFRLEYISKADVPTMRVRMLSVIGSTLMGYLSVMAMLASMYFLIKSEGKKGKLLIVANLFLAFMSNQRAAMVAAILALIYLNYLIFFTFELIPKNKLAIELGAFALALAGLVFFFRGAFMKVYYRLVSLPGAIGQRSDQWVGAANNMANIWLGNGLGANGHRAGEYTKHMIADGGLAKLYCEMGIVGTSLFIFLMLLTLKKGFRQLSNCATELGIIVLTLIMAIGSNMLSFAMATPIFYLCIGIIAKAATEAETQNEAQYVNPLSGKAIFPYPAAKSPQEARKA